MDSEKQPEGFEGAVGWEVGGTRWWVLGRAQMHGALGVVKKQ